MRSKAVVVLLALVFAAQLVTTSSPARAGLRPDEISDNLSVVADGTDVFLCNRGRLNVHGGDLAFQGDLAIMQCGNDDEGIENDGFVIADISDPSAPRFVGKFECVASASDLAVWGDLVFLPVDRNGDSRGGHVGPYDPDDDGDPSTPDPIEDDCTAPPVSYYDPRIKAADIFRGVRIVSIADPSEPRLIKSIPFGRAGAHTVTVLPDRAAQASDESVDVVYLYASAPTDRVNWVIEVPLDDPAAAAQRVTPIDHEATWGCHDISFFVPRGLAVCASAGAARGDPAKPAEAHFEDFIAGASILDVRDDPSDSSDDGASPLSPKLVTSFAPPNPAIRFHSSAFSWDGNTLVLSDEQLSTVGQGCKADHGEGASGGLWFYDISDLPAKPVALGYQPPHELPGTSWCTSAQLNVIPLADGRDVLVSAWYTGGTSVVDFTDPRSPSEIAYFVASPGDPETGSATRAAYFYDGLIYVQNTHGCLNGVCLGPTARGLDVLELAGLGESLPMDRFDMGLQECIRAVQGHAANFAPCGVTSDRKAST